MAPNAFRTVLNASKVISDAFGAILTAFGTILAVLDDRLRPCCGSQKTIEILALQELSAQDHGGDPSNVLHVC